MCIDTSTDIRVHVSSSCFDGNFILLWQWLWYFFQIANYGLGGQYEPHFDFARVSYTPVPLITDLAADLLQFIVQKSLPFIWLFFNIICLKIFLWNEVKEKSFKKGQNNLQGFCTSRMKALQFVELSLPVKLPVHFCSGVLYY